MGDTSPSPEKSRSKPPTRIDDVDEDSLVQCTGDLSLRDVCNMAMSCKYLKRVAYSDPIWQRFSRDQWPKEVLSSFPQLSSVREAYLARHTAAQQLKFVDPMIAEFLVEAKPFNFLHLSKNDIIFSQGSLIRMMRIDSCFSGGDFLDILSDHRARITSMRLFPLGGTSLLRSDTLGDENVMVTSSSDHSIRLWWKGRCQRCFRGHTGPVSTLSDKLLDDGSGKIFASGGEDATVRLWSLSPSGKRGQHALKATLYGHDRPIACMSVAGHRTSLLVSMSRNSKVRVWDTTVSCAVRSSCCVGFTFVPGAPVGMKCHESLIYAGAGSSVVAIDLRTMQKVYTLSDNQSELHSFEILPSKFLICTGGIKRAMLWDIRRNSETLNAKPLAELDGHTGGIKSLHMDTHKIVTAGPDDKYITVWDPNTGARTNMLACNPHVSNSGGGCSALAVDGCRIVTGSWGMEGRITYRDFTNAMCPVSSSTDELESGFWGPQSYSDSDEYDL